MLLFRDYKTLQEYIFFHVPKASGTIIRLTITKKHKYLKGFWGIDKKKELDLAHIPFILAENYFKLNINNRKFIAFLRNPYDRFASGFWQIKKNKDKSIEDFQNFIKNDLEKIVFDNKFNYRIIHIYPMHKFLEDKDGKISNNFILTKVEEYDIKNNIIPIENFQVSKRELKDLYDDDCIKIINKVYHRDFEQFDYKKLKKI